MLEIKFTMALESFSFLTFTNGQLIILKLKIYVFVLNIFKIWPEKSKHSNKKPEFNHIICKKSMANS